MDKEYKIETPLPQYGSDVYRTIQVPADIVNKIRADAIDEYRKLIFGTITNPSYMSDFVRSHISWLAEELKDGKI